MGSRVLVCADAQNFVAAVRSYQRRAEWEKLRDYLADPAEGRRLVEMVIYDGLPPEMDEYREIREGKQRFHHYLRTNGFLVVTREGSPERPEERTWKANVDTIMATDVVEMALDTRPDIVVLVTGDSDFAHVALKLRRRGIRVEVAAVAHTLAMALKRSASGIIDLAELIDGFDPLGDAAARVGTTNVFDEEATA